MKAFNINDFVVGRNYTIEASAGTGKTFSIKKIVKKIVDTLFEQRYPDNHLNAQEIREKKTEILNRILIVTYTEKAAGELKSRIRGELIDCDVDNAPIYTIHSFCKNTISEFGISADQPLDLSLTDDNALKDYIDRYLRTGKFLKCIVILKRMGLDKEIDTYKERMVSIISKYYLDNNGEEDKSIISIENLKKYEEVVKFLFDIDESDDLATLCTKDAEFNRNLQVFKDCSAREAKDFISALADTYKTGFNYNGSKFKTSLKWVKNDQALVDAMDYFANLKNTFANITNPVVSGFIRDLYMSWQEEKTKNKAQNFDDMIRNVRESIMHSDDLLNKLKDKYDYAIIDEFQDTNQKQFDIFFRIFKSDDKHHIIVVGDPKQSIYSFQGADVNVYKKAVTAISKDSDEEDDGIKCYLGKNFRSAPKMVDACNNLFKYYDFFEGESFVPSEWLLPTDPVKPKKFYYKGEEVPAIWIAQKDGGPVNEKEYPHIIVNQIIDLCSRGKDGHTNLMIDKGNGVPVDVTFKDFTILCKSRSELSYIERNLNKASIPYLRYKDTSLFMGRECKQWITLLEAIDTPDFTGYNRGKYKTSLFTSFFGLSLKEISQEKYNSDDEEEAKMLIKWKLLAKLRKWEDLFDSIIVESNLINVLESLGNMQTLSKIKQLADFCVEYLSNNKTIKDLIRELNNASNGASSDEDDEDGAIVARATNFDCVQIMTIHASKGLQFPIVISVGGFKKGKDDGIYTYHKGGNQYITFDKKNANDEIIAENKRLFYVAYTRAEYLMILPDYERVVQEFLTTTLHQFIDNDKNHYKIINYEQADFKYLSSNAKAILNAINKDALSQNKHEDNEGQKGRLKALIDNQDNHSTSKHSYSSLSHGHDDKEDEEIIIDGEIIMDKEGSKDEGLKEYDKNAIQIECDYNPDISPMVFPPHYPAGAALGTALHEIFEVIDYRDYESNLEKVIDMCFSKQGFRLTPEFMESTKVMVTNVLKGQLPIVHGNHQEQGHFSLNEISLNDKKAEMEFNFNLVPEKLRKYCNGFIDLTFRRGDYYSILDWKSDRLNEEDFLSYSNAKHLREHVDNCYSIQRVLYSYCLIKWLKGFMPTLSKQEIFEKHFGGVYYVFLRGCNENTPNGVYVQTWESWDILEKAFIKIVQDKAEVK